MLRKNSIHFSLDGECARDEQRPNSAGGARDVLARSLYFFAQVPLGPARIRAVQRLADHLVLARRIQSPEDAREFPSILVCCVDCNSLATVSLHDCRSLLRWIIVGWISHAILLTL